MAEDNTPTVTARKRKPSGHQRLRLELAKNAQTPTSKVVKKKKKLATGIIQPREPRVKKNVLQKPDKPKAKFRKRQIHKAWLPTHMFHAKRAHMTAPKEPLWRMAIPLSPTQKGYRPTHRASTLRGAIAWDMCYMSTIGLEGPEQSICGILKALGVGKDDGEQFWSKRTAKWLKGTRSWQGWLYVRDGWPRQSISPGLIIWCPLSREETATVERSSNGKSNNTKLKRQAFIRVHPSAFLQLWQELLRLSKVQKPGVVVSDLRFEIGSIELVGPASAEALTGALSLYHANRQEGDEPSGIENVWDVLRNVTSPSNLPSDAVLTLDIADPRLRHPAKTQGPDASAEAQNRLLDVLAAWPIDKAARRSSNLFSRSSRWTAQRSMPSQKAINRRKALADPGQYPDSKPADPKIPVIILASRGQNDSQGSWTILMPWKCVLPIWYSLLYYPLSTGGTVRFGGLDQKRQIAFEHGAPWFPGDYPGTDAGDEWATRENARRKKDWEKRLKGRRVEYDSVKLGKTSKGEVGDGWACDWSTLVNKPQQDANGDKGMDGETKLHRVPLHLARSVLAARKGVSASTTAVAATSRPGGLVTVNLTLLQRGVPAVCARIYRLPRSNPELLQQWLSLLEQAKGKKQQGKATRLPRPVPGAPKHEHQRYLAETLMLDKSEATTPQAGEGGYPDVPDEEDLLGFVTTGNFNLAEGKGTGVGSILLERVLQDGRSDATAGTDKHLCVVRESGQALGRLARWELV